MEKRRLGRLGRDVSVLAYGGAALGAVTQDEADRSIQEALDAGIDYFDMAAGYGDAELRLGPWISQIRSQVFLATKTGERDADAAWAEINRSLERLRTDSVDLIQLHAVGDLEDLDRALGRGGAIEAAVRARDEGLAGAIGITGHGHGAPSTHLEALRRFPFDTVLTPWNFVLSRRPNYAADYHSLVEEVQRQDAALLTIKTVSRRNWPEGESARYATWYEPFDDQERISAAVAWVLSHPEITAIPTAGETSLLGAIVRAERERRALSREAAEDVLARASDYSSPFLAMPF